MAGQFSVPNRHSASSAPDVRNTSSQRRFEVLFATGKNGRQVMRNADFVDKLSYHSRCKVRTMVMY